MTERMDPEARQKWEQELDGPLPGEAKAIALEAFDDSFDQINRKE